MDNNKTLLVKSAMTYGLALGIYWVVKYIFFTLSISIPELYYIYLGLTFAVPFIAYYLTKKYKNNDLNGQISFFHAWRFGTMLYFFAALIVSLAHFIFYQYIAPADFIAKSMAILTDQLKQMQADSSFVETIESVETMSKTNVLTPIHMAIQGIFNNIFYGIILSIPVAALLCKNNKTEQPYQKNEE